MDPMFLPEVESYRDEQFESERIRGMESAGIPVPQILHLFAYKPEHTRHLARYTQAVMRGPSPLSPGMRELIAAFVSSRNQCPF